MVEVGTYELKKEFFKELHISLGQYERRKEELMEWLKEFFDYKILEGKPIRIQIKKVYGVYQPLPRKEYDVAARIELAQQKQDDYEKFTIANLGNEWKCNSKSKIARDAIENFAFDKYGHFSSKNIADRYVGPVVDKVGEKNDKMFWVWYSDYSIVNEDVLEDWRNILEAEHIAEDDAANAFYLQEQGEDISKQKDYYARARGKFKDKYGDVLVRVSQWKLKC